MVLNINMPQFVEHNTAAIRFSALKVHERFFRYWPQPDDQAPAPTAIFFSDVADEYGAFCEWYASKFKGPSDHTSCIEPECQFCEQSRKTFTSVGHYKAYYKAIFFGDKALAERILVAGQYSTPYHERNHVYPRRDRILEISRKMTVFDQTAWGQVEYDVALQANMWKFGTEADCRLIGYDFVSLDSKTLLRSQLLSTGTKSLVESKLDDFEWGAIAHDQRIWRNSYYSDERRRECEQNLVQVQDDPRFHDEDEKDFWGENDYGRLLMEVRRMVRNGEEPRKWNEFRSIYDREGT